MKAGVLEEMGFAEIEGFSSHPGFTPISIEAGSISEQVAASADDRDERGDGLADLNYVYVYTRSWSNPFAASYRCSGLRFASCAIPRGATITSAYLQLFRRWPLGLASNMNCDIYANDADNAANFSEIGRAHV